MAKRKPAEDLVEAMLRDTDNTQSALKKAKTATCDYADCDHKSEVMLEWICRWRHIVCARCLERKKAELSGWESKHGSAQHVPRSVTCCISCPKGCENSTVDFGKAGEADRVRPIHHQVR